MIELAVTAVVACAVGLLVGALVSRARVQGRAAELHQQAGRSFQAGYVVRAIVEAGQSLCLDARHESYRLIASSLQELELFDHAAEFWHEGYKLAEQQAPQAMVFYEYAGAAAHQRCEAWDAAFARADEALRRAATRGGSCKFEGRDYEEDLRATRMAAAFKHLSAEQAWQAAGEDVSWILEHGLIDDNRDLAQEYSDAKG